MEKEADRIARLKALGEELERARVVAEDLCAALSAEVAAYEARVSRSAVGGPAPPAASTRYRSRR